MRISRSEINCYANECETKAYQTYREDGTGYVPAGTYANLTTGRGLAGHKAGELIFNEGLDSQWREAISDAFAGLSEPFKTVNTTLIRRAILSWTINRYPQIISEWKPLGAELPFEWEFTPGFRQPLRLDNILEHREHGGLAIYDFKFTGSPDLNWTERKRISLQTSLYLAALKAVAEAKRRTVEGIIYECVVIGKYDDKKELHKSPFVLGYEKNGKVQPKWVAGSKPFDLTTYSDEKWLEWARATDALADISWQTPVLSLPDADLSRTVEATTNQVWDYAIKLKRVENAIDPSVEAQKQFGRNPENCLKFGWEHACPWFNRCWKGHQLDKETFEPRQDHHLIEVVE